MSVGTAPTPMSAPDTAAAVTWRQDLREKYTSRREAVRYEIEATLCLGLIWAVLLATMTGWLPLPALLLAPLLFIRFELAGHELMHCRAPRQVNVFLRRMCVAQTLYSVDYEAYRDHHFAHHRYLGSKLDPESYLIEPSSWRSFVNAVFAKEVVAWGWIRSHRLDRAFWAGFVLRAGLFLTLLAWNPVVFLTYLICLRTGVGFAEFFFHHCLHRENHLLFRMFRAVVTPCPWLIRLTLGGEKLPILLCHDEHHAFPLVSARHLPDVGPATPRPHIPLAERTPADRAGGFEETSSPDALVNS